MAGNTGKKNQKNTKAESSTKTGSKNTLKKASGSVSSSKRTIEPEEEEVSFEGEIAVWVIGAIMLILELANFGLCGGITVVSKFFFGLFGAIQYLLPIAVLFSVFFLHINEYKKRAVLKVVFGFIVILCIGMITQMALGIDDKYNVKYIYETAFEHKAGGGIICGSLAYLLNKAIGTAGTYILIILAMIICIVLVAEVSVIDVIGNIFCNMFKDDGYDEEDDEYDNSYDDEYDDNRPTRRKRKRNNQDPEFKQIIIEDYSDGLKKEKQSILGSIEVLPDNNNKSDALGKNVPDNKKSVNTSSGFVINGSNEEDVHEIVMDIPVNLPGENMNSKHISNADSADDMIGELNDKTSKEKKSSTKKKNPVSVSKKAERSGGNESDKALDDMNNDPLTESEMKAIMTMENKTVKAEKSMSAKEVGSSDSEYHFPPIELLKRSKASGGVREDTIRENAMKLQEVLKSFGVNVTMTNCSCGPSVTRYEMVPEQGVKVSKITGLADDIMMNLAAQSIRIEAPIPGKSAVGIEIPNSERSGVGFRELIDTEKFIKHPSKIAFAVGKDIEGNVIVEDIAKMPHLLIAGATGSGKSVCTNTLIMSILYKARPDEVKLILVDPKQVELKVYNGIPHLLTPVVTDPKKAAGALNWAVAEMTKRYQMFSEYNVRNIQGYNEKVKEVSASDDIEENTLEKMPQIVIIVDELADLMMVAKAEVEEAIVRLAQLARAAGIHLVIATQRPSVDVVTGLIKANVPSRIALSVSSGIDSRTIIDTVGAEKLLGNGDMLFYPTMYPKPVRVQGAYISDDEVVNVVEYLKANNGETSYSEEMTNQITSSSSSDSGSLTGDGGTAGDRDDYFIQAGKFIIEKNKASIGMLQRMFKIGFNRAARIMDQLSEAGVVGPEVGTKPREVLMTEEQFEEYIDEYF